MGSLFSVVVTRRIQISKIFEDPENGGRYEATRLRER